MSLDLIVAEERRHGFRVVSGRREIRTRVDPDLATSFYEDLRLLRRKSVGIHDSGDVLLTTSASG